MSDPVDTIELDLDPRVALGRMRERGYRHMPVVRGGELVGVVSLRDLMRVAEIGPPEVPRGLKGVVVADTEVGDVRGNEGFYHYRQHSAIELAERRPLEDVWRLLDRRRPPGEPGRAGRRSAPRSHPCGRCRPSVVPVLPAIALSSRPMEGLRTTLSLVAASRGMRPTIDLDAGERRRDALLLCAVTPTVLCALHRLATGHAPDPARPRAGLGGQLPVDAAGRPSRPTSRSGPSSATSSRRSTTASTRRRSPHAWSPRPAPTSAPASSRRSAR